jgi:YHS domain-containing protein
MQFANVLYFVLWAGLFFVMMRYGCGSHIMGHGRHHQEADGGDQHGDSPRWVAPSRAVDPVCGTTVETAGAKSAIQDGQVYYFCSQDCRAKFEADPASYTKSKAA